MQVTFGLSLDSRQGPSPQSFFNAPVVGRQGLLSLLETHLGLSAPEVSAAQRVASLLGHLRKLDDGKRFFSESLKADSIGTAAALLSWRDEWRVGGWDGLAQKDAPPRISDLAAVEQSAQNDVPAGEAERLTAVAAALKASGPGPIESVTLVEPLEDFPWAWRQVLAHLPNVNVSLPAPQGVGQLRALQERAVQAVAGAGPGDALPPIADGSVQVVRSLCATSAEHWLGVHHAHEPADRMVVAEELGDSLDTSLAATGGVNCGFENPSPLRPALQTLGLALELSWSPLDIGRLVDFLTHPVGPFSRSARARLAKAVAEQPGIGGPAWTNAKTQIAEGKDGERLVEEIAFWLESERWSRTEGVPLAALMARVDRMREAMRRRLSGDADDIATFAPAHRQCAAVFDSLAELARQGPSPVLPRQLEQLVAHATPSGGVNPGSASRVGCMRSASAVAACTEPADEVIWWMPSTPSLPAQLPWSAAEVRALAKIGVELRDPARELSSLALQWLRPLLAARQRFVLVLPPPGSEEHPIRQLLRRLCPDLEANALDLDAAINGPFVGGHAEKLPRQPFPEVPRYLNFPAPVPLPKDPQSFTSLNELFNNPALFALKRVASLRLTSVLSAEENNRLLGTLAHRVFESLFANADALKWSGDQAVDWFRAHISHLLETEGAVLLMQGAGVSQQRFRMTCERAITALLDHLRAAGVVRVQTEVEFSGVLGNVPLIGKVDLLLELQDARKVALDIKWRGDKHYTGLLLEGQHLQLALYASLVEQSSGSAPAALGYFLLESGVLLATHSGIFPNAQVRQPRDGTTVSDLLNRAKSSWSWRAGQLKAGQVEVVPVGPTEDYNGPPGTLPVSGPSRWDIDHLVLLGGWEQ